MALETTRAKASYLFSTQTLDKIEKAGLMIVDKRDFEVVMQGYEEWMKLKRYEKGE